MMLLETMFGTILGSKLDPFGCQMGYVLRVPPPLRHEMVVPCFSDASDITKPLKNHGFLMVLLYQRKSCSRRKSFLNHAQISRKLYQKWYKKGIGKGAEPGHTFYTLFGPKLSPKMSPKWLQMWYQKRYAKRALKIWSQESRFWALPRSTRDWVSKFRCIPRSTRDRVSKFRWPWPLGSASITAR